MIAAMIAVAGWGMSVAFFAGGCWWNLRELNKRVARLEAIFDMIPPERPAAPFEIAR